MTGGVKWCHDFKHNLRIGDKGDAIAALQTALQKEGFTIDAEEVRNAEFGESTASAVSGFQEKYRAEILTPMRLKYGSGFVGPLTRAKLNQLYGCAAVTACPEVARRSKAKVVSRPLSSLRHGIRVAGTHNIAVRGIITCAPLSPSSLRMEGKRGRVEPQKHCDGEHHGHSARLTSTFIRRQLVRMVK